MAAIARGLRLAAQFVFCAIPGLALLVFVGPLCVAEGLMFDRSRALWIAAGVASIAVGAPLMLFGVNRWGQWGYLLPFLAVPLVGTTYTGPPWTLVFFALPFVLTAAVRAYYRRRSET